MAPRTNGPLRAEHIRVMRGANYFSWDPVVVLRLDLAAYDEVFTNTIPGFNGRLENALPSLIEHKCSEGVRGGFFMRCANGTLLGHVTEHVALELQALAGIDVAFGKTRATARPGVYNVVFRYEDEAVGMRAAELAFDLVNDCLEGRVFPRAEAVEELRQMRARALPTAGRALVEEAMRRAVPVRRLESQGAILLGTGPAHVLLARADFPDGLDDIDRHVREVLDRRFPPGRAAHAPLHAVAAARGADVARRLLSHCLAHARHRPREILAESFDHLTPVLLDSVADVHVVEVSLATILEGGLPYGQADTGVILNAAGLRPPNDDLARPDDLAYALAVVVEEVRNAGVAVLNADDPHVLEMAERAYGRPVFFTRNRDLRFLSEHITAGNLAVVLTGGLATLEQRREVRTICDLADLPVLRGLPPPGTGTPDQEASYDAVLGVMAALAGNGWSPWSIHEALAAAPPLG